MNEYNEDQRQSQCKDYFKDNFIVWKETLKILANTHFMEGCERLDGPWRFVFVGEHFLCFKDIYYKKILND